MRLVRSRQARVALAALALVACTSDRLTSPDARPIPTAPDGVAAAVDPALLKLVITEVMADPSAVADETGEWFELFNPGPTDVTLNGFVIRSGVTTPAETHTITSATTLVIRSGGYAVLARTANALGATTLPADVPFYVYGISATASAIQFNNSTTDWLGIWAPGESTPQDSVSYSARSATTGAISTPTLSPTSGASRAVVNAQADNSVMAGNSNWILTPTSARYLNGAGGAAGDRGTPGTGPYTKVDVTPAGPPAVVSITSAGARTTVTLGATLQLTAAAVDANGRAAETAFAWSTSDASIATVSATGLVTGVKEGSVTITATADNGVAGTFALVAAVPGGVARVQPFISGGSSVLMGVQRTIGATFFTADNTTIVPAPAFTWSLSDSTIAKIEDGMVTGLKAGRVTLRATAANGIYGETSLTVVQSAPANVLYRNVEFGLPTPGNAANDLLVVHPQFTLSYNQARGGPNWVSWSIVKENFGTAGRCDCFSQDQSLPAGMYKVSDADYRGALDNLIDRGHMVQSDSRTSSTSDNATTFYMTNILPQAGENNQGPWQKFEEYLNDKAELENQIIYVVAGGEYPASPTYLRSREGATRVAMPTWTWKVAVIMPRPKGLGDVTSASDLQVVAIRMPNDTTPGVPASARGIRNHDWQRYEVTVDQVEARTGYDVLSLLPDHVERQVEAKTKPPVAVLASALSGAEYSPVTFDGTGSSDPDGDALTYAWDFGDGITATGATTTHRYNDDGTYTATLTVSDVHGVTSTATTTVTVANVAPTATFAHVGTTTEGGTFTLALNAATDASPVDAATLRYAFDCGDGAGFGAPGSVPAVECASTDDAIRTVRARVQDKDGGISTYAGSVTITNVAPVIASLAVTGGPVRTGTPVTMALAFGDEGALDTHAATVSWGDGSTSSADVDGYRATASHTYAAAGLYSVSVTLRDDDGGATARTTTTYTIVVDPTAGFLTGGGWFTQGADKAHFTLHGRYLPDGALEGKLELRAAGLEFDATALEWLVLGGSQATLRGTGTIAGRAGSFEVLATVIDAEKGGPKATDRVRIRIWNAATGEVVFDDAPGLRDGSATTLLGGGNVDVKQRGLFAD